MTPQANELTDYISLALLWITLPGAMFIVRNEIASRPGRIFFYLALAAIAIRFCWWPHATLAELIRPAK